MQEMYKASKDAFYIGEKKMNIHDSDIKQIFGMDCGTKPMDISYGPKPKTGIINKRCKNVSRLTLKWIRTLLTETLNDKKKDDNEEVVQLYWLCEHTTILQPHKPNAISRCVKWDLTALHKKIKSTLLANLGFNEVNASELFATQTELQKFKCTTLKVEPQCDEPATTSPELANIKKEQHNSNNSEFPREGVDLNDTHLVRELLS
ncbi:hypothetical protein CsSME_00002168 [Camellia sinensis var. sinensis]